MRFSFTAGRKQQLPTGKWPTRRVLPDDPYLIGRMSLEKSSSSKHNSSCDLDTNDSTKTQQTLPFPDTWEANSMQGRDDVKPRQYEIPDHYPHQAFLPGKTNPMPQNADSTPRTAVGRGSRREVLGKLRSQRVRPWNCPAEGSRCSETSPRS